jgi:signal transduction histidine kinase
MVFLARRLDDAQGKFAGVVYAGIDITYFVKLFSELDVGKNGRVSLRNLDHVVIARTVQPDGQLVGIGSSKITPTFKAILDSKTNAASFMSSGADEIERLFYYRKISRYPLYVTIGLATSDYMSEWREGAVKTIALALLFSLISCAGGALVRHSWKRQEALAALLEQRVLERTAELETANNELRRASAQLIQAEKLSALGSLVAGVSHELNTPIGNMRLTASSLSGRVQDFAEAIKSEGMRRSQLYDFIAYCVGATELIDRAAVRSGELIQSFKQVAVDQTSLRRRRFDLKHTIDQTVLTLTPLLKRTNFSLQVDIPDGIEMEGYPGPLEQVLTNFVTNSLAHAFTGRSQGQMLIRARQISEGEIELEYRDDGLGIPADIVARVFDPFFTTKFGHGGSGLGLYTVYNIVSGILGGVIELDGRPGQGARFIVRIPLTSPQQSGAEEMAL